MISIKKNCESIGNKIINCVRLTNSITRNVVFWCMNRVTNMYNFQKQKNCVQSSYQIILPMTSILHISIVSYSIVDKYKNVARTMVRISKIPNIYMFFIQIQRWYKSKEKSMNMVNTDIRKVAVNLLLTK